MLCVRCWFTLPNRPRSLHVLECIYVRLYMYAFLHTHSPYWIPVLSRRLLWFHPVFSPTNHDILKNEIVYPQSLLKLHCCVCVLSQNYTNIHTANIYLYSRRFMPASVQWRNLIGQWWNEEICYLSTRSAQSLTFLTSLVGTYVYKFHSCRTIGSWDTALMYLVFWKNTYCW